MNYAINKLHKLKSNAQHQLQILNLVILTVTLYLLTTLFKSALIILYPIIKEQFRNCQSLLIFNSKQMLILTLLTTVAIYWVVISLAAYYLVKKTFKYYSDHPKFTVPDHYRSFMRQDFGRWNQTQIIKGCFLRLPWKTPIVLTFLIGFGTLGVIKAKLIFPDILIDLWRRHMGKLAIKSMLDLHQKFDPNQKITAPITISNHVNWFDFTYLGSCFRKHSALAKAEVKNIYVLNSIAQYSKSLYVDRSAESGRFGVIDAIKNRVQEFNKVTDDSVYPILIFPEGTVSSGRAVMSFKNGAFDNLTPINIFSLKYDCKDFHMGMDQVNAFFYTVIVLCLNPKLTVKRQTVKPDPGETLDEYRQRCRKILAEMGQFQIIDSTYKDMIEYQKMKKEAKKSRS